MSSYVDKLRAQSPGDTVRLAWKKLVYRRVSMRRVGAPAGQHVPLPEPTPYQLQILGPDDYHKVLGTSQHLTADDLADFDRQKSVCIVAYDGDRLAASTWMTSGSVRVHELHREVPVPSGQHFSTRTFVDPDYRGTSLMSHLIYHYAASVPESDLVWGLVYDWNVASLRSLERVGWQWTGDMWTKFVAGRKFYGEDHREPVPAASAS